MRRDKKTDFVESMRSVISWPEKSENDIVFVRDEPLLRDMDENVLHITSDL